MSLILTCGAAALIALAQPNQPLSAEARRVPPPETVRADEDESRGAEASVMEVTELHQGNVGAKLYGTAGGDPAMNGLYTYLAFYVSTAEGHRVFRIGDFNGYDVFSEAPGRIVLEVSENYMDARSDIQSRTRRLTISWTVGRDDEPPTSIRVVSEPIAQ